MAAILAFAPSGLSGFLLAHLLWPDRHAPAVLSKAFLGVGIGLGLRSLLYFIYLLILPGGGIFLLFELVCLALLLAIAVRRGRLSRSMLRSPGAFAALTGLQRVLLLLAGIMVFVSVLTASSYLLRRRQGDWDAWMMYNRAARFLYRDQEHWQESFSPRMDPIFHADYPLLLAANIAAGWDTLGRDSAAVPMLQSALFSLGCVGLFASSLAPARSIGQAGVGLIILLGVPAFVNEGARQMADVPMAFYILAVGVLLHLYVLNRSGGLLVLAGLAAGLAAWTKNEGAVLAVGASAAAVLVMVASGWRQAWKFLAGLAFPAAVTLYFKLFLAPAGDILTGASAGLTTKLFDLSRHLAILRHVWSELVGFGAWGIPGFGLGIVPILAAYLLIFGRALPHGERPALVAGLVIVGIQFLGYYAAYLVSPYDLEWHLAYSSARIVLQVFPLVLLLILLSAQEVERVLSPRGASPKA